MKRLVPDTSKPGYRSWMLYIKLRFSYRDSMYCGYYRYDWIKM